MFSTRRRQLAWLLGLAAVSATGVMSFDQQRRYAAAQEAVRDAMALRQAVSDTLSLLTDAETGQRGYLLTKDEAFLGPYDRARQALPVQLAELGRLVEGDAQQLNDTQEIARLSAAKLAELTRTVELARHGHRDQALTMVREGTGRRAMLDLRAASQRMQERQGRWMRERGEHGESGRQRLAAVVLGSTGLFLGFMLWGMWSAARGVREARRANQRLVTNEAALRLATDNATDLVRVVGPQAELIYVSPSCQEILQYSREEMVAMPPRELLHPDERQAVYELMLRVQAGGGDGQFIHRLRSKDGSYRWFETTYGLVQTDSPSVPHIHLASRDITRRKAAEDSLQQQTARLHSILASMGDGVIVLDPDRRVVIINPAAREFFQASEGALAAPDWERRRAVESMHPEALAAAAEPGPLTRALRGEASAGTEVEIRDRNGITRTLSITASPLQEGDTIAGCVAVYHDITEQRHAERDLSESEARLRMLSEASFEGVVISKAGVVIDTNATFAEWLGRQPYELVGVDGITLFVEEDRSLVNERRTQPGVAYEACMLRSTGERFPVEVRSRHATFRGETVRIAVIRDITERRRRESEIQRQTDLLRALSLRDELTGTLNRRGFLEHAQQQLRFAERARRSAGVFFLDLDGMKGINDTHGHEAGDAALVHTSQLLQKAFRASDIIARLGGDEFAVLAPDCDAAGIAALRERIHQCVSAFNQGANAPGYRISLSVGTAAFDPLRPLDLDALLEHADREMYEEKRAHTRSGVASRTVPRKMARASS